MDDLLERLNTQQERLQNLLVRLDLPTKEADLTKLENQVSSPSLWSDPDRAKQLMRDLARLREHVQSWRGIERRLVEARELVQLGDEGLQAELAAEVAALEEEIGRRELEAMLSGKYDSSNAVLAIHAGAGGTDAQDWTSMLRRMYLRWAESHHYEVEVLDETEGEEAGTKSVTLAVDGASAYGYLRSERGVHRLVRLSPFDAASRRHTSFALVEVYPQVKEATEVEIPPTDLRIETYRASSAGGQNVQKNETAIRITHLPTGIVVTCQNERSQTQNRENALRVLRARLLDLQREEQERELAAIKGEHVKAEWGNQIRSYVLHPYQMVKDHRTGYEASDTSAVLDGEIDPLIESYLRFTIRPEAPLSGAGGPVSEE
ncbi:MAG: peptide chain release factor 2 [Anaerolineales bacterium]